jgi:beta-mannosidase
VTGDNRRELVFVAELWSPDGPLARQTAFFVPTKHLALVDPQLTATCSGDGGQLRVELCGRSLARLVELELDGADVVFSDNYFDLPAGRVATITCPLPAGWSVAQAQDALRLRSVYESFQPHRAA